MNNQLCRELLKINELTRNSYNIAAIKYHHLFKNEMNDKEYDRILLDNFAGYFRKADKIIDAGCGPSGHVGRYLFDKGLNIIGIDISEKCIQIAKEFNTGMIFRQMNMCNLELEDNSVDGIISFYSIIHTPKKFTDLIFNEFARVLKPNGKLLVTVKKGTGESFIEEFLGYKVKIFFTYFREEDIRSSIQNAGMKLISLETREPIKNEIEVPRIYTVAEKI